MDLKITNVQFIGGYKLKLTYAHGAAVDVDLAFLVEQGGVFDAFRNETYFKQVQIMEHGYYLRWPDEVDIGADSLWLQGTPTQRLHPPDHELASHTKRPVQHRR